MAFKHMACFEDKGASERRADAGVLSGPIARLAGRRGTQPRGKPEDASIR